MAVDIINGEIPVYGILKNDTEKDTIAYAHQIEDTTLNKKQSTINAELNTKISNVESTANRANDKLRDYIDRNDPRVDALEASVTKLEEKDQIAFFEARNTKVHYIIDQRGTINDPDTMVSENFVFDDNGNKVFIPENLKRNPQANCLAWLRANSHNYVTHLVDGVLHIKQLDDTTRKKFADGTSSVDYISNETGDYNVMMKINSDVYWKTEPYTPDGETTPNDDYILVTIARKLSATDNEAEWQKWSKNDLIGTYESFIANNKLYSLSGKRPTYDFTEVQSILNPENPLFICTYKAYQLIIFLFYGFYSSLGSQEICGSGTTNVSDYTGVPTYNPKITGITDNFGMNDTENPGNDSSAIEDSQIIAGIGPDVHSVNFWGLENIWGDTAEDIIDINKVSGNTISYYFQHNLFNSITITKRNNNTVEDVTYNSDAEFTANFSQTDIFIFVADNFVQGTIARAIHVNIDNYNTSGGTIGKMMFGKHCDIIPKASAVTNDCSFCDNYNITTNQNFSFISIGGSNGTFTKGYGATGISCLQQTGGGTTTCRLMFTGTDSTVQVVDTL